MRLARTVVAPVIAPVLALGVALAVAGCGGQQDEPTLDLGGDPSPSATTTVPSASPSARPTLDEQGHEVFRGKIEARGDRKQAVVDAWIAYWQVRLDAYHAAQVDPAALGGVATGDAAGQVVSYVATLKSKRHHTVGDLLVNVDSVEIAHGRATVSSCMLNRTRDHDEADKPVESPDPFLTFRGTVARTSAGWRVSEVSLYSHGGAC